MTSTFLGLRLHRRSSTAETLLFKVTANGVSEIYEAADVLELLQFLRDEMQSERSPEANHIWIDSLGPAAIHMNEVTEA